jgi:hypothetical protein
LGRRLEFAKSDGKFGDATAVGFKNGVVYLSALVHVIGKETVDAGLAKAYGATLAHSDSGMEARKATVNFERGRVYRRRGAVTGFLD